MRTKIFFAFSVVAALATGCGKDEMTPVDMGTAMDPVKPAMATTQIERMGRGTINVAVTNPFDLDYSAQLQGATNVNTTRDLHSKDGNQAGWAAKWTPVIARTLGIYDGVDRVCGNQFGACGTAVGCGTATAMAGRYSTLAGVLADDQLLMDTSKTDCGFYLALEATALGVTAAGTFCGGRTPLHDVVDVMYTAATVGAGGFPTGPTVPFMINDGVPKDNETTDSLTTFPFLSDPN